VAVKYSEKEAKNRILEKGKTLTFNSQTFILFQTANFQTF
jgi:hypothetical protein